MINIIEFSLLRRKIKVTPTQIIVFGFAFMILVGTLLLNLPAASGNGLSIGLINSLFTATSSVCVTGLVVVDTGTHWTLFGQLLILLLIQVGGLGFMTISTLLSLLLGRRITLKERLLIQESLNQFDLEGLVRLTKNIIIATFIIEFIGAIVFSIVFVPEFGMKKGIAFGVFHSISAFCNAGFDLIGDFRSFTTYTDNFIVNANTMLLIIIGGLGFSVWIDIYRGIRDKSVKNVTLHGKVVILTNAILILSGAIFIFIMEFNNADTIRELSISGKLLSSFFQSITPRTAGFNTLDMTAFRTPTKLMTIILMFIGGSPGSTAGGVKTSTAAILFLTVISVVKGKEDPEVFERHLSKHLVYRAMAVAFISLSLVVIVTMLLSITEDVDFMTLFFESASAFGTVGLTLGCTRDLSAFGKAVIIITMFAGRVGPLTIALALTRRAMKNKGSVKYPEDRILVG